MTKDKIEISTCRKCRRIIKHAKGSAAKCPDCISDKPIPDIIPLKRTEEQHYQEEGYHEEDYLQIREQFEIFTDFHKRIDAVYSTRSVNAMFDRATKELDLDD